MPRKPSGDFDQSKYINEWAKEKMGRISIAYKKEFVDEFKEACKALGLKQSQVFRDAMRQVIDQYHKQ